MTKLITVDFRQDTIFAVERDDGVFVAVTPICKSLGLDPKRQRDRIQRDPIMSEGGAMMALPSLGGEQETFCLRLDLVNGWLFTIDESRVKDEETRQKVLAYKRECYGVLFRHFYGQAERTGAAGLTAEIKVLNDRLGLLETALAARDAVIMKLANSAQALMDGFDQTRAVVLDYKRMLTILKAEGVEEKGRRPLSQRCSRRCNLWLIATKRSGEMRVSLESGYLLFHVNAVRDWLAAEGRELILAHKERITGQTVMQFPRPKAVPAE